MCVRVCVRVCVCVCVALSVIKGNYNLHTYNELADRGQEEEGEGEEGEEEDQDVKIQTLLTGTLCVHFLFCTKI